LTPADVETAQLYDGFSMLTLSWIEALGFCGKGEAKDFLMGGGNISRDGLLPLNTNGGQLSGGRTHGFGYFYEAILQMRGEAGERQLAHQPRVAVVANGGQDRLTPACAGSSMISNTYCATSVWRHPDGSFHRLDTGFLRSG
jgi:acetyl-CoA acetyltransferase